MESHWYLVVAVVATVGFLIWLFNRRTGVREEASKRSILDYILVWPLLLSKKKNGVISERGLTKREWIGWILVVLVAVLAVLFTPRKGRGETYVSVTAVEKQSDDLDESKGVGLP